MTRPIRTVLYAVAITVLSGAPAFGVQGEVSAFFGLNALDEDRLDDAGVGTTGEVGIRSSIDFGGPVVLALDLLRSSDDATRGISTSNPLFIDTDVETIEFDVGIRTSFARGRSWRPYIGTGVALLRVDVKQVQRGSLGPGFEFSDTVIDDGDSSVGYWVDAGLAFYSKRVVFGLDVRYANATADVKGVGASEGLEIDAGGIHYGLFLGHHW